MELYKTLKIRKGEKKSFKRVDHKKKKERMRPMNGKVTNIVAINSIYHNHFKY